MGSGNNFLLFVTIISLDFLLLFARSIDLNSFTGLNRVPIMVKSPSHGLLTKIGT